VLVSLAVLFFTAGNVVGLLISLFVIAAASASLSPAIQTRLMDVAHDSQSIAAALNHSALNMANASGAFLGGLTIAAGFGYLSPIAVGVGLCIAGIAISVFSFGIDRRRSRRAAVAAAQPPQREPEPAVTAPVAL
jgi:DHA1 family inner membrane transport protein